MSEFPGVDTARMVDESIAGLARRAPHGGGLRSAWPARVLVVEDEPALAELLHRTLRVAGFDVRSATTCAQARQVAVELAPELALLDVMLPDGSGFDLSHSLRLMP